MEGVSVAAAEGVACATRPPNKRMKLTKSGWIWGVRGSSAAPRFGTHPEGSSKVALFAAYPRCSADLGGMDEDTGSGVS